MSKFIEDSRNHREICFFNIQIFYNPFTRDLGKENIYEI